MIAPHLLTLPLELRLQIYNYALHYNPATVTISTAQLEGSHPDIIERLYGDQRRPYHGIPKDHIPVIEPRYDPSLLSIIDQAVISARSELRPEENGICDYSPKPALLLVNRQINAELNRYMPSARKQGASLFVSYPHGLHVLDSMGLSLLQHAKTVQIVGEYTNSNFNAAQAVQMSVEQVADKSQPDISSNLSMLISDLLGREPRIAQLQLRIFYPGANSYSTVWGDDSSPTVIALRNIFAGEIQVEVWRGEEGTGVSLAARPSLDGKRSISTAWRRLNDGVRRGDRTGSWVIDSSWPDVSWSDSNGAMVYKGSKELALA